MKAREELSDILSIGNPQLMRRKLEDWSKVYSSVGISQLTRFTKTISNRMDGIVSRATFRISSGKIEGVNGFIYQDFDYFAYLIWEQTHKDSLYGKPSSGGPARPYPRKKPYNQKRLKQTVFRLPENSNKEAV